MSFILHNPKTQYKISRHLEVNIPLSTGHHSTLLTLLSWDDEVLLTILALFGCNLELNFSCGLHKTTSGSTKVPAECVLCETNSKSWRVIEESSFASRRYRCSLPSEHESYTTLKLNLKFKTSSPVYLSASSSQLHCHSTELGCGSSVSKNWNSSRPNCNAHLCLWQKQTQFLVCATLQNWLSCSPMMPQHQHQSVVDSSKQSEIFTKMTQTFFQTMQRLLNAQQGKRGYSEPCLF